MSDSQQQRHTLVPVCRFTLYERKHHCRNCGQVFCGKCSRFESEISRLRILKPVRVCQACFATLRHHSMDS